VKRLTLLSIVLLLLVLAPLTVLGQDEDTIVVRNMGNIDMWNNALTSSGPAFQGYSLIWPLPFAIDPVSGAAVPGLTSWEVSDDGLTYTFHILEDANWSDGVPISSADMKFVLDAIMSDIPTALEEQVALVDAVNVIDDKTYEITMSTADCSALSNLGSISFLPSHLYAADFSDFETNELNFNPVGISGGPYILDEYRADEFAAFHANPNWWGGEVKTPFLINRIIGEEAIAVQSIQAGEIDYTYFHGDLWEQLSSTDNLQWEIVPRNSVNFVSLNWANPDNPQPAYDEDGNLIVQEPHPLFSDINVRKAVAMGYNKTDILDTLGGAAGGVPLVGQVPPTFDWAYNHDIEPYAYDPAAAEALLDEAGWLMNEATGVREKDGVPLAFTIRYSDILLYFETTAIVMQDQLNQIGFDVTLEKLEWTNYVSEVLFGQRYDATPMSNSGGTRPPDPAEFMNMIQSTSDIPGSALGMASYVNPRVDELIRLAQTVPGCAQEDRAVYYREMQQILHDEVAYDYTFVPTIWQTANSRIDGFDPSVWWVFYAYTSAVPGWSISGE
jgi:ABC-type transport system substrate-binding protein